MTHEFFAVDSSNDSAFGGTVGWVDVATDGGAHAWFGLLFVGGRTRCRRGWSMVLLLGEAEDPSSSESDASLFGAMVLRLG